MPNQEREHTLSVNCWCQPIVLAYGATPVYDAAGALVRVEYPEPDAEDEDEA